MSETPRIPAGGATPPPELPTPPTLKQPEGNESNASLSTDQTVTPPPSKKGDVPAKAVDLTAAPQDPYDPLRVGQTTEDRWAVGRKDDYWTISRRRREKGGENELSLMVNTTGGGIGWKANSTTPFGDHFGLTLGYGVAGYYKKSGDFHVLTANPSVMAGMRFRANQTQLDLTGQVDARLSVAHNPNAQKANDKQAKDLSKTIEENFEALKKEVQAVADKLTARTDALKEELEAMLKPARDKFAQLLAERLQPVLAEAGQAASTIIAEEVAKALGDYMAAIGGQMAEMADNMRRASTASSPAAMQSALAAMAGNMDAMSAMMTQEAVQSYMQAVGPAIAERLQPVSAETMSKIGEVVNATATEVGSELKDQMQAAAGRYWTDVQAMGGALWKEVLGAYANTLAAAENAWDQYQSAWQAGYGVSGTVGLRLEQGLGFLSSDSHNWRTTAYLDARYTFPIASGAWADKGAPSAALLASLSSPAFRGEAGLETTKWFGSVGMNAAAGVSTQVIGTSVSASPTFHVGVTSRF